MLLLLKLPLSLLPALLSPTLLPVIVLIKGVPVGVDQQGEEQKVDAQDGLQGMQKIVSEKKV